MSCLAVRWYHEYVWGGTECGRHGLQKEPSSAIDVELYTTNPEWVVQIHSDHIARSNPLRDGVLRIYCKALQGSILATVLDMLHTHDLPNNSILHLSYIAKGIFVAVKARESWPPPPCEIQGPPTMPNIPTPAVPARVNTTQIHP